MKTLFGWVGLLALLVGCGENPGVMDGRGDGAGEAAERATALPPPDLVAWTTDGDLALVNGDSGSVRSVATSARLSGSRAAVFDPWASRVVTFEGDLDGPSGEVATYAVASHALGERARLVSIDGDARPLPSPLGPVLFEASYGSRWRVLLDSGAASHSAAALAPRSAWITSDAGGTFAHGVGESPEGTLVHTTARVDSSGVTVTEAVPLPISSVSRPSTAQVMPGLGALLFVDVVGPRLVVFWFEGTTRFMHTFVPVGTLHGASEDTRVGAALALDGGSIIVVTLSKPSRLVALALNPQRQVASHDMIGLAGELPAPDRFFRRDLVANDAHRVYAATSEGVWAADVSLREGAIHLTRVSFPGGGNLRGPLDVVGSGAHAPR